MKKHSNHYETLGVPKTATDAEIKRAFRKKASKAHPDKEGGSSEKMVALNKAWMCLGDTQKRIRYDQTGDEGDGPSPEQRGQGILVSFFNKELENGSGKNVISSVRKEMNKHIKDGEKFFSKFDVEMKKFLKSQKNIRKKNPGFSILHEILNQKIRTLELNRLELTKELGDAKEALKLLDEYEEEYEEDLTPTREKNGDLIDDLLQVFGARR